MWLGEYDSVESEKEVSILALASWKYCGRGLLLFGAVRGLVFGVFDLPMFYFSFNLIETFVLGASTDGS